MANNRLSFSIAINLLTENFKKGTNTVKNSLRSMQMQVLTFAAALGAGGLGLSGLISRFRDVARETSRVMTALKNVSDGTKGFTDNLRFVNDLAKKYGLEINALVGNFAKFTASATQANMPMEQQKKVFESVSRAITAFSLSTSESDGVMLALSQMMSKGKISMEELRKQMGEKLPVAIQAMAKALGVSIGEMEKLIGTGKVMSADVLPKFADALNEIIPNVDTDNLETSLSRLSNAFGNIVDASGFQNKYKTLIDGLTSLLESASKNIQNIIVGIVAAIGFIVTNGLTKVYRSYATTAQQIIANEEITSRKMRASVQSYTEAKKRLSDLELQYAQANGQKQITLAKRIEDAKLQVQSKTAAARQSIVDRVAAHEAASYIKTSGKLGVVGSMFVGTAKKIGVALKSLWASFSPAIIVSAIIALIGYFKGLHDEANRVKKIFSDYKNEIKSFRPNTNEIVALQTQLKLINSKTKGTKEHEAAVSSVRKMLGLEKGDHRDLNKLVQARIKLLQTQARVDLLTRKQMEAEDTVSEIYSKHGGEDEFNAKYLNKSKEWNSTPNILKNLVGGQDILTDMTAAVESKKIIADTQKKIDELTNELNIDTNNEVVTPTDADPDKKKDNRQKAIDNQLKLQNAKARAELEGRNKELENQQAILELDQDGFDKQQKQIDLNHKKEILGIDTRTQDLIEKQQEAERQLWDIEHPDASKTKELFKTKTNSYADLSDTDKASLITDDDIAIKQREKAESDLLKSLLDKYQDYGTRRIKLEKDYNDQLAFFETKRKENPKAVDAAVGELEKQKTKAVSSINLEEFQDSIDWSTVFGNLDRISTEALQGVRDKLKNYLSEAGSSLAPTDLQTVTDAMEKMNIAIADREPINELKSSYEDYKTALVKVIAAKEKLNGLEKGTAEYTKAAKELTNAEEARRASLTTMSQSMNSFGQKGNQLVNSGNEIIDMLGAFGVEVDENVSKTLAGVGQVMSGLQNIDLNKPFSIVTSSITMLTGAGKAIAGIFGLFGGSNKDTKRYQEMVEQYDALNKVWDELISKKKEYITTSYGEEAHKVGEEAKRLTEKQIESNRELGKAYMNSFKNKNGSSWGVRQQSRIKGDDWKDLAEWKQLNNISDELYSSVTTGRMTGLFDLTAEQLQSLKEEAPSLWAKLEDQTKEYLNNIIDGAESLEDINKSLKEQYTQISIDSFKDNYVDLLSDMDSSNKDFADNFEKYIQKAILSSLIGSKYKTQIESLYDDFANANSDGNIDEMEMAILKKKQDDLAAQMIAERDKLKETFGWESESSKSQDSTKAYSTSMDQDTGGAILGRMTGVHESILTLTSMVGDISIDTSKSSIIITSIGDELKKHTGIFYEMQQIQQKSYYLNKEMQESLGALEDIKSNLSSINKNTRGLAPK